MANEESTVEMHRKIIGKEGQQSREEFECLTGAVGECSATAPQGSGDGYTRKVRLHLGQGVYNVAFESHDYTNERVEHERIEGFTLEVEPKGSWESEALAKVLRALADMLEADTKLSGY